MSGNLENLIELYHFANKVCPNFIHKVKGLPITEKTKDQIAQQIVSGNYAILEIVRDNTLESGIIRKLMFAGIDVEFTAELEFDPKEFSCVANLKKLYQYSDIRIPEILTVN